MPRFATDFSEFSPGAGLPAGFSTSDSPALYSVASVSGANVLRVGPHPDGLVSTFFDAPGDVDTAEVYVRARWTNAEAEGYFDAFPGWSNEPLGAALHDGDTRMRITPSGVDVRQGLTELVTNSANASSALAGDFHMVLRYADGRVYGALWAEGAAEQRTWNYIVDVAAPVAGLPGLLTGQWLSTVEVLFIGVGTAGDDAPRTLAALAAPRRPSPFVTLDAGVASLDAGVAAALTRFRVLELPEAGRYTAAGAAVVLDSGWLAPSTLVWGAAATDREYGLEVTVRDGGSTESAPSLLEWFTTGEAVGRTAEGLAGFDLFGHRPAGCSDGVPVADPGGLVGSVSISGLPPGAGVLIERAGDVLYPTGINPFTDEEYPQPVVADLDGGATVALPADAVALRIYSLSLRQQGNAAVQYLDLDAHRALLLRYEPEHGPQPGDAFAWEALPAPGAAEGIAAESAENVIRLTSETYAGAMRHAHTRWRVWSRYGTCPVLVYDSGWSTDREAHSVALAQLPAGFSVFVTATFRDIRGIIGPASEPLVYRVPLVLFYGPPSGGLEFQAEFQTGTDEYLGTSSARRPDAIVLDYLTAFCTGPVAEADVSQGLLDRAWRARCVNGVDSGTVYMARSSVGVAATREGTAGDFEADAEIFSFAGLPVLELDVAFEQSARPVVCLERATGAAGASEVWLYWYDPRIPGFTLANLGAGRNPRVILDDPGNSAESDVLLFYISDPNDRLEMRVQREFYAVPHATPIEGVANTYCEEVAFARNNRLHVILSVRDAVGGRYKLAALESAPYPVRIGEELDVRTSVVNSATMRSGFVVEPGGVENTSDIDEVDVLQSLTSVLIVELVLVALDLESLDARLVLTTATTVELIIVPPDLREELDVRHTLTLVDALTYILAPAVQGPESVDLRHTLVTADAVTL